MNQFDEFTLNEYLDGSLDEMTRQQVEQWLSESAEARAILAELQLTFSAMENLEDIPLEFDLSAAIVAQIEGEETAVFPTWARWVAGIQLIAAVSIAIAMWPIWQDWFSTQQTALSIAIAQFEFPTFTFWQQLSVWLTDMWQQIQIIPPTIDLATNQWSWLLALAFLAWIAGNRLLFSENPNQRGNA